MSGRKILSTIYILNLTHTALTSSFAFPKAGVYTNNWNRAHYAFEEIEAGGVCINSTPSVRIDSQAYGGVKDSGIGREGIKYAIEDYTEVKVMVMKNAGKI